MSVTFATGRLKIQGKIKFKAPHTRRPEYRQLGMHRGWSGAGIGGEDAAASSRFLKKYKSRDESRDLYFSEEGLLGSRRACPNGPSETPDGHVGQLRWPHGASQPRRPKLDSAWFASTKTGLLSPRFFQKSLAHVHAQPHARTCRQHEAFSLGG